MAAGSLRVPHAVAAFGGSISDIGGVGASANAIQREVPPSHGRCLTPVALHVHYRMPAQDPDQSLESLGFALIISIRRIAMHGRCHTSACFKQRHCRRQLDVLRNGPWSNFRDAMPWRTLKLIHAKPSDSMHGK